MNREATFALRFVMKDFAKMRKGIEQVNKNLEQMQKNANKASGGMNKLNTSMGKTIRSIGKFALAYFALSKVINTTFKKAQETIQIDLMAQSAGVAAEKIGKLGKALRLYGGDARSAGSAYSSLTDIIGGAQHGMGISQDVARVNAMYGIGFNYGNISQDELMTNIATKMKELRGEGDQWAINQIAKAYGLDAPMAEFLAKHGSDWVNERNKKDWQRVSKSETQRLIDSQDNLDAKIAQLGNVLIKYLPSLIDGIVSLVNTIESAISIFPWRSKNKEIAPENNQATTAFERANAFEKVKAGKMSYEKYIDIMQMQRHEDAVMKGTLELEKYNALREELALGRVQYDKENNVFVNVKLEDASKNGLNIKESIKSKGNVSAFLDK